MKPIELIYLVNSCNNIEDCIKLLNIFALKISNKEYDYTFETLYFFLKKERNEIWIMKNTFYEEYLELFGVFNELHKSVKEDSSWIIRIDYNLDLVFRMLKNCFHECNPYGCGDHAQNDLKNAISQLYDLWEEDKTKNYPKSETILWESYDHWENVRKE